MASRRRTRSGTNVGSTLVLMAALAGLGVLGLYVVNRVGLPSLDDGRIPTVAYEAYRAASDAAPAVSPGCSVDWTVLAGISQVEARHGRLDEDHQLVADGEVLPWIRGAALDGTQGTEPVPDTDGGALDGDPTWDRAMGPLQFIPTTWAELGRDGNGDGVADPDNLFDASLTAVAHLCLRTPGDYSDRSALRRALVGYNASGRYAEQVLGWIERYSTEPLSEVVESADPDQPS